MKILLRRSNKLGSRLIRWCTGEDWSHIGVQFVEGVYHSDIRGCRISTLEEFSKDSEVISIDAALNFTQMCTCYVRANRKVGSRYDLLGVVGFGLMLLAFRLNLLRKPLPLNPKWLMCSEYVEYILFGEVTTKTPVQVLEKMGKYL